MVRSLIDAVDENTVAEFQLKVEVVSGRTWVLSLLDVRLVVGVGCLNFSFTGNIAATKVVISGVVNLLQNALWKVGVAESVLGCDTRA